MTSGILVVRFRQALTAEPFEGAITADTARAESLETAARALRMAIRKAQKPVIFF